MKAQTVYGWVLMVFGFFGMVGSEGDYYTIVGGLMIISAGWIIVDGQSKIETLEEKVSDLENEILETEETK